MVDSSEPLADLVAQAHDRHVVVIGGGIAGLVSALECAKLGVAVTLVESADRLGGTIADVELDGVTVPTGVTCFATAGGAVRRLIDEVGPAGRVVAAETDQVWVGGLASGAAPLPADTVRGIPANPWAHDVRALIGWSGAWRAYLDRLRPPMTIGVERSLARLVRSRMGRAVLERMVAPISVGVHGIPPEEVDVEIAAPGLSTALTRTGSLGGAVAELLVGRSEDAPIESIEGGMSLLVDALQARLVELGARIRTGTRAVSLARAGDGRWEVDVEQTSAAPGGPAAPVDPAHAVIVATDETAARALLGPVVAQIAPVGVRAPIEVDAVTLLVDAAALDVRPRGSAVYGVPGASAATGVGHETARWRWLADAAGPGGHVLRVSFGSAGAPPATAELERDAAVALAADEAAALLGVARGSLRVRGGVRRRIELARPAAAVGRPAESAAVRAALAATPGLAAAGAWLSGSGLAHTVADAVAETDRIRRAVLWGGGAA